MHLPGLSFGRQMITRRGASAGAMQARVRDLADANRQLHEWVMSEAGNRLHGTTREQPLARFALPVDGSSKRVPDYSGGGAITPIIGWLLYADPDVAPLRRSSAGSFTPILWWRQYADPGLAP
jgi:hypothetical protein